jgi:hypothetical protein
MQEHGQPYAWTPCREAALEEPQAEGIVYDRVNRTVLSSGNSHL